MPKNYDFGGWATRVNLKCSDGRVIMPNAFCEDDGVEVPLVWNHQHGDVKNVLGHALLENREEGVYAYGYFNDTEDGQAAKAAVLHGDIKALSIYANRLQQNGPNVQHGKIREVSLVLAGANPKAFIDTVVAHSEDHDEEAIIYTGEPLDFPDISHNEDKKMDEIEKKETETSKSEDTETIQDIFDTLNEKQKKVVYAMIGMALSDNSNDNEGEKEMKQNAFDTTEKTSNSVICHADQVDILDAAKKVGSFRAAYNYYMEQNSLQHDDDPTPATPTYASVSGFTSYPSGATPAGVEALFPEWHDVRPGAPELVTDELGWVDVMLRKVHKSPFSRIRTNQVDLRNLENMRGKGYNKGTEKTINGNYAVAKRTTDPQTIYVKSALNRDDVVDITDFDYVAYQYNIDRMQLNEELATAILLGDGRDAAADYKIEESHIRPIYGDDELFTIYKDLTPFMADINGDYSDNFGDNYKYAEAMVAALLDAKIDFKGTGTPDMFCTQQFFNRMMLAKDLNGRRIYSNKNELATALGVDNIYPVSKMANVSRTKGTGASAKTMNLDAILINLSDYALGSTKGGEVTHFTDFDIDFNQLKSLLETRVSGANTRIYSAIVIEEVANP